MPNLREKCRKSSKRYPGRPVTLRPARHLGDLGEPSGRRGWSRWLPPQISRGLVPGRRLLSPIRWGRRSRERRGRPWEGLGSPPGAAGRDFRLVRALRPRRTRASGGAPGSRAAARSRAGEAEPFQFQRRGRRPSGTRRGFKGSFPGLRMASISATPKSSLADEPVKIRVTGLEPSQLVTIRASLTDEKGVLFQARAFYWSDKKGQVDLTRDAASGGDYSGVQPMGLFLFLKPEKPFSRLKKRDVMNSPYEVRLDVFDSLQLVSPSQEPPVASQTVERWYTAPGVQRIPVRHGRVRGALFLPAGNGPFPGVIDLFGGVGGLVEFRASLLASRGFATLALAYFAYEDLPSVLGPMDLEYFEEAAEFLLKHPKVRGPSLGIVAICKGAEIALAMATYLPQIGAAVCINGTNAVHGYPLYYRNLCIQPIPYKSECMLITDHGVVNISNIFEDPGAKLHQESVLPVEKAQGKILLIVGESDGNYKSKAFATEIMERMKQLGKTHCALLSYPKAGHLIEPPGSPFCHHSWLPAFSRPVLWGGEAQAHAAAQVHSWSEIQKFLHLHLGPAKSSSL